MKEKTNQIMLAQDNILTQSRQDFSVIEKRCLYQIIREVRNRYIETNTGQKDLFDNMYLELLPSTLATLGDEPKDVYKALKKLAQKDIEIETEDTWVYTHWILQAKHEKKRNIYTIDVSRDIMPYLVELASEFTTYDLTVAISLKSTYSQRFYEYCSQYKNRANKTFFFTVEKLREMLMLEDKYPNIAHFKQKVLDVAQKEIKDLYDKGQCDLWFDYAVKDTEKRKVLSYFFFVHTKEEEQTKVDYQSVNTCLQRIMTILGVFFPRDKKYIKRVIQEVQLRPDIAMELLEKLDKKVMNYDKKEIAPIIRYVLNSDYGIK
ncbi:MAG: replication initiation protein [Peptostreptococcaceae bacterium]